MRPSTAPAPSQLASPSPAAITRRAALRQGVAFGLTVVGGAALAACGKEKAKTLDCTDTVGLSPAQTATRQTNEYVDRTPDPAKACSGCQLYKAPAAEGQCGGCTVVAGPIHPQGYCKLYTPRVPT